MVGNLGGKIRWGFVLQQTMGTPGIIVQTPIFNDNLSSEQGGEPFALQTFVPILVVEAFDETIFHMRTRRGSTNALLGCF